MADEVVLIKIDIDQSAAVKDLENTEKNIIAIKDAQAQNTKEFKEGKISQDQYVQSKVQLDNQLKKEQDSRKNLTNIVNTESNSLNAQKQKLAELVKERNNLDRSTEEGAKKFDEINKQVKSYTESIGKAEKEGGTFTRQVGDYSKAIDRLVPGFDGLSQTVQGTTGLFKALAATPLLAVLSLVVAAVAAVVSYFSRTEEGADLLAKTMAQLTAVFNVILDRVALLGGALVKLFTGDFIGAINDVENAFSGVTDEIAREVKEAGKLADILDQLEDRERNNKVAMSETTLQIKRLILESKNRLLTEQEKIDKLNEASELEKKTNRELLVIRQDQLSAALRQIALTTEGAKVQQKYGETFLQFAKRIVASDKIQGEERQKVADAIIAYNEVEGESLNIQEKISNQIDAQNLKRQEKIEKMEAEKEKAKELAEKQDDLDSKRIEKQQQLEEKILESQNRQIAKDNEKTAALRINAANDSIEKQQQLDKQVIANQMALDKVAAQEEAANKKRVEDYIKASNATLDFASYISDGITKIKKQETDLQLQNLQLAQQDQLKVVQDSYDQEVASLKAKLDSGEISEEQYREAIKAQDLKLKESQLFIQKEGKKQEDEIKRKAFESNKKNQIIQTTIDAIQSAAGAFRSLVGIPFVGPALAAIAAAAALAFGYKQVENIRRQEYIPQTGFADGGYTGSGGKYEPAGIVHRGEVVWNQSDVAAVGGPQRANALRPTFKGYADGGIVTANSTREIDNQIEQMNMAKAMADRPVIASWQEWYDLNRKISLKESIVTA